MGTGSRIEERRSELNFTQEKLAARVKRAGGDITQTGIDKIEKRDSKRPRYLREIAIALGVTESWLLNGKQPKLRPDDEFDAPNLEVPVVGYVGAGSEMHHYADADNPNDFVPMIPGGNEKTVAVEIRGTSLGSLFDQWLVYYDEIRTPPTVDMIGKICVVALEDDRVLVKRLRRGTKPDHYHLESQTEGLIEDARIVWAAKVKHMTPR